MNQDIRIGALISGSGTNLQAIMDACESGQIRGRIVFIGSDNPDSQGLKRGEKFNIPTFIIDYSSIIRRFKKSPEKMILPDDFNLNEIFSKQTLFPADVNKEKMKYFLTTRAIAEAALLEKMKNNPFDLLVLAGFMRNLTPYFIDRVNRDRKTPSGWGIFPTPRRRSARARADCRACPVSTVRAGGGSLAAPSASMRASTCTV